MGTKLTLKSDIYSFGIVLLEVRDWLLNEARILSASKRLWSCQPMAA